MAEIEIGIANMSELDAISKMDLGFESSFVWQTRESGDAEQFSVELRKVKLPKSIEVPFQAYSRALEGMMMRREILAVRYEHEVIGYDWMDFDEVTNRLIMKTGGIRADYRRKGIGSMLLERLEEIALHNKIHQFSAVVQAKNDPAIRFLTRHGFRFCGYQEFYFPNLEIGLFLSKNIR